MSAKWSLTAFIFTAVFGVSIAAQAATVSSQQLNSAQLDQLQSFDNPVAASFTLGPQARPGFFENVTGSQSRVRRSPWEQASARKFAGATYSAIRGAVTYLFSADQTGLSLLWGSTDVPNTLTLLKDGREVAVIQPGVANAGGDTIGLDPRGAFFVSITDTLFNELRLSTNSFAFEYANLATTAAVPVPAAGVLMLSALGGATLLRRRQHNRT